MRSPRSLSGKAEFAEVFAHGRRGRSDGLTVWVLSQSGAGEPRIGMAVPARAGGAVKRNRARRRLRALLRGCALPHADIVIRVDKDAVSTPFQELECHLVRSLEQAGAAG
jgi:ribonuclease P protein component